MTESTTTTQDFPALGFGLWQVPETAADELVQRALSTGYRLIDTAEAYYNEQGVGAGLRAANLAGDELIVQTKVWNTNHGYDSTLRAFDASLSRLGLDHLDIYLMHWPSQARNLYVETWRALKRLRDEGRVSRIGVCNFAISQLKRLAAETGEWPFLNQVELHPYFQQRTLRDFHDQNGILTQAWSPLGIWTGRPSPLGDRTISDIATKHGRSDAQIILRWHLDEGHHVISKSERPERILENFSIFDFTLDDEDLRGIRSLDRVDGRNGPDPETATF